MDELDDTIVAFFIAVGITVLVVGLMLLPHIGHEATGQL